MNEYENLRRVAYDCDENGTAQFVPVCPKCGRYVKEDDTLKVSVDGDMSTAPNATCKKCGRVIMHCEGYF